MESRILNERSLSVLVLAGMMSAVAGLPVRAADNNSGFVQEDGEICRLAGGSFSDLGGGRTRCCLPSWGCWECDGPDNCSFECQTRRCCKANGFPGTSQCFIFAQGEEEEDDDSGPVGGRLNGTLVDALLEAEMEIGEPAGRGDPLLVVQIDLMEDDADEEDDADSDTEEDEAQDDDSEDVAVDDLEEQSLDQVVLTEDPAVQMCGAGMLFPMMLGAMGFSLARRSRVVPGRRSG